ncbi:hypothetical protein COCNU_06G017300 [Cocos nucifera]|uniref:Formamidase n=1 Tax=Cocos nucifera TaxID=13894 RepID=A0A8K0N3Q3_COCNU|nr:hypothetical protein COCNU_06G017300 [Cocos nucifera]
MAPQTPRLVVPVDVKKKPWEQKLPLHNRWHPHIPPVADVTEGEIFRVEMVDAIGGQVGDNDSAADIKSVDLTAIEEGTPEWERIANEAARTIPGRENGGNCDIKNLSRGSKVYLPVFVDGANLSTGDMHFSQGDGEVSFCGAIEMSGFLELKCEIIRGGTREYLTPMGPTPLHLSPIFEIGPVEPRFSEWLVFEGISVDEAGRQHFLDATVAYKRAVLNAIDYLSKFGYSKEQVYLLLSCCPCEGRISGIVDSPNAVATLAIPTAIFDQGHYLSGPLRVLDTKGVPAKPGDLLAVEICNLGPLPGDEWGYTATFDRENGGGFLTDHFPSATKAIWYFEGIYAYSPHIPGVRFPGLPHPGVVGTAPSPELLSIWNEREKKLAEEGPGSLTLCQVVHQRPLVSLPTAKNCLLGLIEEGTPEWERIANEAARTVPGRENGGNCDIKNLSRGSKVYLPVFVDGANLSTGDMHFSQGDGEVSFCGAIEMSGFLELKCEIIRGGMREYLTPMGPTPLHVSPIFEIGPVEPRFSEWLVFEGISVDEAGRQHYLDATVAYKRAVLNAIDYLSKFGYSKEQAYLLLSCCPCEGRISGIVDSPNALATLAIPTAIFDQMALVTVLSAAM